MRMGIGLSLAQRNCVELLIKKNYYGICMYLKAVNGFLTSVEFQ